MNMRTGFTRTALASMGTLVFTLLLVSACCDGGSISLGRISAFLSGVFEVTFELEIDGSFTSNYDGDPGGWAQIPALDDTRIETDLSATTFSESLVKYDVDLDVIDEPLKILLVQDTSEVFFIQWSGDAYTADKGVCYLGWHEFGAVKIAASHCDDDVGVMYCRMNQGSDGPATCIGCYADEPCVPCDMKESLGKCLPSSSSGSSVDLDVDIDIDIDIDMDVDLDPELG